jgi:myosin V
VFQGEVPIPHGFATAATALRQMLDRGESQTVLISGESGAGKTESAKVTMRFISVASATMCGMKSSVSLQSSVEGRVNSTNPILESFGNAKTSRKRLNLSLEIGLKGRHV